MRFLSCFRLVDCLEALVTQHHPHETRCHLSSSSQGSGAKIADDANTPRFAIPNQEPGRRIATFTSVDRFRGDDAPTQANVFSEGA